MQFQLTPKQIYCTVGSEAKRVYLTANHGIPSTHIFNSRDSSFLPDVLKVTDGRGVDVVLNSLSGDLLQASWQCVAEFGTMVEIGKRDFRRRASLAMAPFEANRTFVGLDLDCLVRLRPRRATKLLLRCVEWLREGRIANLTVSHTFPAGKLQEALRTMQTARHIGKIVVTMPCGSDGDDVQELLSVDKYRLAESQASTYQFKSDCTYLLVGGLGGIGRAIASWMVENGARSLIFLSRSAREGPATNGFIRDLLSQGCRVDLVDGSVTNKVDVARAVNKATSSMPLAGVINISTVLRDVGLREMTFADWNTTVGPKVRGTWQLHDAIPHEDQLDFFVLISSSCGIMGHLGQANYTAANTFLDAFVRFRHRRGLVASVIDLGVMGDVGFVAENQRLLGNFDNFDCFDMRIIREKNMLDALVLALQRSRAVPGSASSGGDEDETAGNTTYKNPSQIIVGLSSTTSIFSPLNRVPWRHDIRMSIYHNLTGPGGAGFGTDGHGKDKAHSSSLRLILQATADDAEKTAVIMQALTSALAAFLIKNEDEIPLDRPLELIGMDSLVAMEVRNWIRQQVGAEMSTISILQSPSVLHLAEDIKAALGKRAGAATGPGS